MTPRLSSALMVSALVRRAEIEGGFAAVLSKGDANSGAILVVLAERGRKLRIMERLLQPDGDYLWTESTSQAIENQHEVDRLIDRRRRFDPDLWVLELDIPSPERFAAEMNGVS